MKCLYVYNPKSGKQKSEKKRAYVLSQLSKKFDVVDCKATEKRGDASIFAKQACGKYDVFVVSGGDGTLNEVINGIAKEKNKPKIGYIPTGTTNDFAHSLKISTNVKKAVKTILEGKTVHHDIFRAGDRFGIYVCCFGVFTKASYDTSAKKKKKFGRLAYFGYGIKEMFHSKSIPMKITYQDGQIEGNFALAIFSNSRYVAGFKINKKYAYDDGFVSVVLVKNQKTKVGLKSFLKIFRLFLFGTRSLKNDKNTTILKLDKFKVELPQDEVINLDGESANAGSFDFEVFKKHVEIFC